MRFNAAINAEDTASQISPSPGRIYVVNTRPAAEAWIDSHATRLCVPRIRFLIAK